MLFGQSPSGLVKKILFVVLVLFEEPSEDIDIGHFTFPISENERRRRRDDALRNVSIAPHATPPLRHGSHDFSSAKYATPPPTDTPAKGHILKQVETS